LADSIGRKIRQLRLNHGLSQEKLAETLNVSVQQLHKYETGKNRISVEKLLILAKKFGVDLNHFADDIIPEPDRKPSEPELTAEEKEVIAICRSIRNERLRKLWMTIGTELSKCAGENDQK
jgi:transcriptional regulator with XRE-family HTH domain